MKEDKLNSAQMRNIIMERIAGDVMNQVIRMDVDHVEGRVDEAPHDELPPTPPGHQEEWANSLGYSPMQGAVGKIGAGTGYGGGKAYGKDHKGGGKVYKGGGKDGGQGAGKGERPVGACSHCWGFGHYYRACPVRLGPEADAQAETYDATAVAKGDKGKGNGKGKLSKGKGKSV